MDTDEPANENDPLIGLAGFACFASLSEMFLVVLPLMNWFYGLWIDRLIGWLFFLAPILIAFTVLYRSRWRREWPALKRILFLLSISVLIYAVLLIPLIGFIIAILVNFSFLGP